MKNIEVELQRYIQKVDKEGNIYEMFFNLNQLKEDKLSDKDIDEFIKMKNRAFLYTNNKVPFNFVIEYSNLNPKISQDIYNKENSFKYVKEYNIAYLINKSLLVSKNDLIPDEIYELLISMNVANITKNQEDFLLSLKKLDLNIDKNKRFMNFLINLIVVSYINIIPTILKDLKNKLDNNEYYITLSLSNSLFYALINRSSDLIANILENNKEELDKFKKSFSNIILLNSFHTTINSSIKETEDVSKSSNPMEFLFKDLFQRNIFGDLKN